MRTTLATISMAVAGLLTLLTVGPAAAQDFRWNGRLTSGQSIEIRGINGDIRATASGSGDVEVTATKTARRGNPDDVRIEVVPHAGGVTICAVYPSSRGREPNTCEPGGGKSNTQNNDTTVNFDVRVPYGVNFVGRTVNGEISGESLQGDGDASTVNGSIKLTTTGVARAHTVNGSLNVTMGRADWQNEASFKTVNGEINLTLPSVFDAELRAETLNGSITSDFPITVTGQVSRRRLSGTIGAGGRSLNLATVNGSIKLMRAQ
jgi:Putative adhesin